MPGMGNREDLLAGARRCLVEKGWARTTIRDITAAAGGVSMAAIGYHFGSREALLNAALIEAIDEWGTETGRTLSGYAEPGAGPAEQYEAMWERIIESFTAHRRCGSPALRPSCKPSTIPSCGNTWLAASARAVEGWRRSWRASRRTRSGTT